jgi:hypothetical protein
MVPCITISPSFLVAVVSSLSAVDKPVESEQNKNIDDQEGLIMLTMTVTMFAFAAVYALLGTMLSDSRDAITAALRNGTVDQTSGSAVSRCLSRA